MQSNVKPPTTGWAGGYFRTRPLPWLLAGVLGFSGGWLLLPRAPHVIGGFVLPVCAYAFLRGAVSLVMLRRRSGKDPSE